MMLKVVVFGMLATVAFGQMSMFGGMSGLTNMLKNVPDDVIENAVKDLNPEKIKQMMKNLPPEVEQMVAGMGFSKEQLEQAVEQIPEDFDFTKVVDQVKGTSAMNLDSVKGLLQGQMQEMGIEGDIDEITKMIPDLKKAISEHLKQELGIDIEDSDKATVIAQLKDYAIQKMKENGFDITPEKKDETFAAIRREMKMIYGVDPDMDDAEFQRLVVKNFLVDMKEQGFDVDPEHPEESMEKMKQLAKDKAQEFGIDISEGFDAAKIKEQVMAKMVENGVPIDDPSKLMPYMMEKFQEFMPLIQSFMQPQQQPMMPRPPMMMRRPMMQRPQPMPLTLNLEINMDEGDHPTTVGMPMGMRRNVMSHMLDAEYGIGSESVSDDEVMELLQDLLHYRTMAKYLIAKNEILQNKVDMLTMSQRPVMSRSPMMAALLHKCKHHM